MALQTAPYDPDSKTFGFDEFDILIVKVILGLGLLSHVFKTASEYRYSNYYMQVSYILICKLL